MSIKFVDRSGKEKILEENDATFREIWGHSHLSFAAVKIMLGEGKKVYTTYGYYSLVKSDEEAR